MSQSYELWSILTSCRIVSVAPRIESSTPPLTAPPRDYLTFDTEQRSQQSKNDLVAARMHHHAGAQFVTLVQAATLGKGLGDLLFDAFLQVARHNRPPLATPDGESPPPTGTRIWVPPIDWGPHLVGYPVPGRVDTKGRTRYHEPNMAHPPPCATPTDTKAWERETWVDRMASLSNFRDHDRGDITSPKNQQPAASTYMTSPGRRNEKGL